MLSDEQRAGWERDGFLVLPGFVDPAHCDELRHHAEELLSAAAEAPEQVSIFDTNEQTRTSDEWFLTSGDKVRLFYETDGTTVNKIGHAMHDLDPVFDHFSRTPALAAVAADIGFRRPVVLQSMYILKRLRVGGEVTSHTDHTFLWTEPMSVTGFWFALEDATLENGCLWALPGGHRLPVRQRFRRDGEGGTAFDTFVPDAYPTAGEVPLEAAKGTLVLLHGALPHRSDANRSERSRAAYTVHAIEADAQYPQDNWLQRRPDLPLRGFGGGWTFRAVRGGRPPDRRRR